MNPQILGSLGVGLVFGLSALGSAIAVTIVGSAAVGAWKRCYKANKPAPMTIMVLCGMPLSQVFYGFILLGSMLNVTVTPENAGMLLGFGVVAGLTEGLSAIAQGKIGAAAADAISDTGKGFANYVAVMGIAETVALFTMVFTMISLG
jgi:V/A-type H+-transporting ATPase subunit K